MMVQSTKFLQCKIDARKIKHRNNWEAQGFSGISGPMPVTTITHCYKVDWTAALEAVGAVHAPLPGMAGKWNVIGD